MRRLPLSHFLFISLSNRRIQKDYEFLNDVHNSSGSHLSSCLLTHQFTDQWNGLFPRPDIRHRVNGTEEGIVPG